MKTAKSEKPTIEYPTKLYVRTKHDWHYPGADITMTTGEKSILPHLDGDEETEVAVYQLVRVAKFKRVVTEVVTEVVENEGFKKLTTEIVEEV